MEKEKSICFSLKRVNHIVERGIHTSLAAAGFDEITNMHGWILGFLYHAQQPVYQKDIESNFGIARSTVTNILQLMERKGYIERQSVPQDARLKRLILTEEGGRVHEKTMLSLHQTDEFVAGLLTEEENAELLRLLNKLRKGLE